MTVKIIPAQMMVRALILSMDINVIVNLVLRVKIANTCLTIARVSHAKMVPHVLMKSMDICANVDPVLLAYNVKVCKVPLFLDFRFNRSIRHYCFCYIFFLAEIDECLSDPCNPIGTEECIDFDNKFVCKCRTGYSGELCEGKYSREFVTKKKCLHQFIELQRLLLPN